MTRPAHPAAGRNDSVHGDENWPWLSARTQSQIEALTERKIAERIDAPDYFDDLIGDTINIEAPLQRCLRNLPLARKGELHALQAITEALTQIERSVTDEARQLWLEECEVEARNEVMGVKP